ncbi:MAG: hemerythrin family protein [Sterolibacterium sp.]
MEQKYYIGVPEIDAQHEEINALVALLREAAPQKEQRRLIHQTLKRLHQLLRTHFEYEESLMAMVAYPDLPQHKKVHKGVLLLFERYFDDPPPQSDYEHYIGTIGAKVFAHVMEHDAPMTTSIKERLMPSRQQGRKEAET